MLGVPATGNPLDFRVALLYEVAGGQITRIQAFFDVLTLLQQTGALPAPGATPAAGTPTA